MHDLTKLDNWNENARPESRRLYLDFVVLVTGLGSVPVYERGRKYHASDW